MDIIRFLHSWNRWFVIVVAVVAVAWMVIGLIQKRQNDKTDQTLMKIFNAVVGVQWLLGLILLLVLGSQTGFGIRHFWEHLVVMTVAVGAGSFNRRWKDAPPAIRYRNNLLLILGVLVLIVVGLMVLPAGIRWRFYAP